jgi:hypothetical protein
MIWLQRAAAPLHRLHEEHFGRQDVALILQEGREVEGGVNREPLHPLQDLRAEPGHALRINFHGNSSLRNWRT